MFLVLNRPAAWESRYGAAKYCINICGSLPDQNSCGCDSDAAVCRVNGTGNPENIGKSDSIEVNSDNYPGSELWLNITGDVCTADPSVHFNTIFYLKCGKSLVSV